MHEKIIEENIQKIVKNIEDQAKSYGLTLDEFLKIQNTSLDTVKENLKEQIINVLQNSLITELFLKKKKLF